ncbi:MAG TPA: hypothetical protein DIU15_15505 [Deltaproteobacteria bacterium]|nr:hypothetical protein [Deltaproteobacteria bacterium]HCP47447.1 hypothetical protein [Deltaproteobacteria bacterium]
MPATLPLRVAVLCGDRGICPEAIGGAAVHLRGMVSGFQTQGSEVALWTSSLPPVSGTARHSVPLQPLRFSQKELAPYLKAFRPQLVYERLGPGGPVGERAARAVGAAWALEVNAPLAWEEALFRGRRARRRSLVAEGRALSAADKVIVVSASLAEYLIGRGVDSGRVLCVPNGYTAQPGRPDQIVASGPEGDSSRPYVLGYAGTFKPWQGMMESIEGLLQLAGRVLPRRLQLELWGDGPDREEFVSRVASAALPLDVCWRGWGTESEVALARGSWDAAWIPLAAWPPTHAAGVSRLRPLRVLERAFGERVPERWFCPLKEVEARAAGLPLWCGTDWLESESHVLRPRTWHEVAGVVLVGLGFTSSDASCDNGDLPWTGANASVSESHRPL